LLDSNQPAPLKRIRQSLFAFREVGRARKFELDGFKRRKRTWLAEQVEHTALHFRDCFQERHSPSRNYRSGPGKLIVEGVVSGSELTAIAVNDLRLTKLSSIST
jgi:hypothetical protein